MPYVLQGGLGLPEREYYLSSDAKMADIRAKYRAYIATILTDAGLAATPADAEARAGRIFDLESKIAQAHESREQSEDFQHANAEWTRADFAKKAPGIDWDTFFTAAGLPHQINLPLSTISRSRASPRWSPPNRWMCGRIGWPFIRSTNMPRSCRQRSMMIVSPSMAPCFRA
jgi:predicted metalloendopeptidase